MQNTLSFRSQVASFILCNPHKLFILKEAYQEYLMSEMTTDTPYEIPHYETTTRQVVTKINNYINPGDDEEEQPLLTDEYDNPDLPENSVAFHRVQGLILADFPYPWYFSTKRFRENFIEAENNSQISSHLIYTNSGGGEAWYLDVAAQTVKSAKKPVIRIVEKVSASAAEYLGFYAKKTYAATPNEIIGSIGTMVSFFDFIPWYQSLGIKHIEEYAPQSDLKNKKYNKLRKSHEQAKQYIEEELKPLAEQFITALRDARPALNKLDEKHPVFRGETFTTPVAIEIGLIDGQKLLEDVVIEAIQEGKKYSEKLRRRDSIFT